MGDPVRLDDAVAAYVADLVAAWPPLTPAQRDRLAVLLRPQPHVASESPSPVAPAGTASHGLSAGARPQNAPEQPHVPSQRARLALLRPAFRATSEATE